MKNRTYISPNGIHNDYFDIYTDLSDHHTVFNCIKALKTEDNINIPGNSMISGVMSISGNANIVCGFDISNATSGEGVKYVFPIAIFANTDGNIRYQLGNYGSNVANVMLQVYYI